MSNKILEYLRLCRIQTAAATALVPVIGALTMNQHNITFLFILFLIGFLYHIGGFVLNEYIDVDVDKKSLDLQKKPLVSGIIHKSNALAIAILSNICLIILVVIFFLSLFSILFILLAVGFGIIYNVYGKRLPGLDFVLAGGFFFLCLMGASTVSTEFTLITYIICLLYFIQIVFNNAVEGGLKDVDHDFLAGAKTIATRLGVKIKNGKLIISKKFVIFSYSIKVCHVGLIILACLQPEINIIHQSIFQGNYAVRAMIFLLMGTMSITMYKFWHPPNFDRQRLIKLFGVHEMLSYSLILAVLYPLFGLQNILILFLIPFIGYTIVNGVLYGNPIQPRI